ncbi:glycoside hydrolase family 3 protein [Thiospirochaeta perfilievii]|uniref:beta-N-acetylhexosaminidase n=1 Tax=Thiospirochaeta perfilievii TaxID=252967 RepID=A0A5C1QGW4_9SPIO|nr:glycoside hydrolase family 3 protein [Thiospirochaeta perfilievii]QEN05816.1 glycoside hydrolase family 3 protein [Thiospirochaeta perfilievii]
MLKKHIIITILISIFAQNIYSQEVDFYSELPNKELSDLIISQMSDEELLGQVLMFSYEGDRVSAENLYWVKTKSLGSIKIFGWNATSLYNMVRTISRLQEEAKNKRFKIPLLIATDQEGGWVQHIRGNLSTTPGNLSLGATGNLIDSYNTGVLIGNELKTIGINMNFAPTVDIYQNKNADVIGPRSFSSDPVLAANLSVAFFKGLDKTRVITTAKHFPGHGNTDKDSHGTLPIIKSTLDDLYKNDLIPYQLLFKESVPAVMMGHLGFPNITKTIEAASLSKEFVTDLLKEEMGFKGVAITDDLFMHGARVDGLTFADECKLALLAGNDILLVSKTARFHQQIWDGLLKDMKSDQELKNRVIDAATKVLRLKLEYLKGEGSVTLNPQVSDIKNIPFDGTDEFIQSQAARSITVVKDKNFPYINADNSDSVLLISNYNRFMTIGKEFYPEAKRTWIIDPETFKNVKDTANYFDTVIFCLTSKTNLRVLETLKEYKGKLIVLSFLTPVYLDELPWVDTFIAAYGQGEESMRGAFSALKGFTPANGTFPLNFKEME